MANETNPEAPDLSVLGTQLSSRILAAEKRFAAIRNKCDHYVITKLDGCVPTTMLGAHRQGVGFKKEGKTWNLYFVEEGEYERDPGPQPFEMFFDRSMNGRTQQNRKIRQEYLEWKELSQASLIEKSKAVKLLPRLFSEMQTEYERRKRMVSDALATLDQLEGQLPPAKEGE